MAESPVTSRPEGATRSPLRGELGRRWAVAAVGIPLGVGIIYLGGWVLTAVLVVIAAAGARELFTMATTVGGRPLEWIGIPGAVLLVVLGGVAADYAELASLAWGVMVALTIVSFVAAVWLRGPEGKPLASVSATLAGVLLLGATLPFALLLRHLPDAAGADAGARLAGTLLLIFPLVVTWLGDSAAYFAGKRWGRRKLLPRVSPAKTVVGGAAGLAASVAGAGLYAHFLLAGDPWPVSVPTALVMGVVLGVAAQAGDLAVSVLKRDAGLKDSGALFPGHGGVLDRFDSVLVTVPTTYLLLVVLAAP